MPIAVEQTGETGGTLSYYSSQLGCYWLYRHGMSKLKVRGTGSVDYGSYL